jgi:hypothetical protein
MKSFSNFCTEAYDAAFMSGAQVIRTGEGGRIGAERRKTAPERTKTKRGPGGTTLPAKPYKPRSDIGTPKPASTRVQEPTKERGSKDVLARAAAAAREERMKAAKARAAAKSSGQDAPKAKPRTKELEGKATQILSNKKEAEPKAKAPVKDERFSSSRKPEDHMVKGKYNKLEKKTMVRAGKRKLLDLVLQSTGKKKESELKNRYTGPDK